MASSKIFALAVSACALATASGLAQRHPGFSFKRSQGTVAGAENGTSYYWNSTSTIAQCPDLTTADLQTSLEQFNGLFPPESVYSTLFNRGLRLTTHVDTMPALTMPVKPCSKSAPCISLTPRAPLLSTFSTRS